MIKIDHRRTWYLLTPLDKPRANKNSPATYVVTKRHVHEVGDIVNIREVVLYLVQPLRVGWVFFVFCLVGLVAHLSQPASNQVQTLEKIICVIVA